MEAIVLAGGFGTRLKSMVSEVPKPMAPIHDKPFLQYLLEYLRNNDIKHVILAVGYKSAVIEDYFGFSYKGVPITYSKETSPLGTGGAMKQALDVCTDEYVAVLNGDTYFDVNLHGLKASHEKCGSQLTLTLKAIRHTDRYGRVAVENGMVTEFMEKKTAAIGLINGGIYLVNRKILNSVRKHSFSFEQEVLESGKFKIHAYESEGYFIDIGVPEDYRRAQKELPKLLALSGVEDE